MNLALIRYCFDNALPSLTVNPVITISNSSPDTLDAFKHISLELDQTIYLKRQRIDWVLFAVNEEIRWADFLKVEPAIQSRSNTIFITESEPIKRFRQPHQSLMGNFYTRPHVFTLLGSAYKIGTNYEFFEKPKSARMDLAIVLFAVNRTGYDILNLP